MNIKENLSTKECEVFLWQDNFPSSEDDQCALMDKLFVQFWSFSAMKICPIAFKINQSKFKILPNTKWTLSKWPKFLASSQSVEILPHMVTQKVMPCFMLKDKIHYFLVSDQGGWERRKNGQNQRLKNILHTSFFHCRRRLSAREHLHSCHALHSALFGVGGNTRRNSSNSSSRCDVIDNNNVRNNNCWQRRDDDPLDDDDDGDRPDVSQESI